MSYEPTSTSNPYEYFGSSEDFLEDLECIDEDFWWDEEDRHELF